MKRNTGNFTLYRWQVLLTFLLFFPIFLSAQKMLDHDDFGIWRTISGERISDDGNTVVYVLEAEQLDPVVVVFDVSSGSERRFDRADRPAISADGRYVAFSIHPGRDALRPYKKDKKKKEDWPSDTLALLSLQDGALTLIPDVDRFSLPEKWNGWLFYSLKAGAITADSFAMAKKESDKAGSRLVVRRLADHREDTLFFVKKWTLSEESPYLAWHGGGGPDSSFQKGLLLMDLNANRVSAVDTGYSELHQWAWHDSLPLFAWISRPDSLKDDERANNVYLSEDLGAAQLVADSNWSGLPRDWRISPDRSPMFTEDGQALFFGTAPVPLQRDSNVLDEEWPVVEVWNTLDEVLYTQQVNQMSREKKRSYLAKAWIRNRMLIQLGKMEIPNVLTADEGNSPYALGVDDRSYQRYISWEGHDYSDLYLIDTRSGTSEKIADRIYGSPAWSPHGKYLYWYEPADSSWVIRDPLSKKEVRYGEHEGYPFADEVHDIPLEADSYGGPGWIEGDRYLLVYDRYDIWKIDPTGTEEPVRITRGREGKERFRLIRRDREQRAWPLSDIWMVHRFSEVNKGSGYGYIDPADWSYSWIMDGPYRFSSQIIQSRATDRMLFTRENYDEFPDLRLAEFPNLQENRLISNANPQQKDYGWGSIELHRWMGPYGREVEGMLVKPAGFSPDSTYPMIVNFYEKSADGLHTHRHPYAHRSTINYSFYASRGYLIFNPDIHYTTGDPGKNALDHVIAGVDHIIRMGFVDTARMALQGHSWGGYQIAHIITKTNRFRCAESGAPVVNMVSAYGGIRWGTGMSRMFQYEKTQSRLGATLWEDTDRYLRNSPVFDIPAVETPV